MEKLERKVHVLNEELRKIKILTEVNSNQLEKMSDLLKQIHERLNMEANEKLRNRVSEYIKKRNEEIMNNQTPISIDTSSLAIIDILPQSFLNGEDRIFDVSTADQMKLKLKPLGSARWDNRYNSDGFLTFDRDGELKIGSYVQVRRNGSIEIVDNFLLTDRYSDQKLIPSKLFEDSVIECVTGCLKVLREMGVEGSFTIAISLLGVKGYQLEVPRNTRFISRYLIDKDHIELPTVTIDEKNSNIAFDLKPAFDVLWNAGGFKESQNY